MPSKCIQYTRCFTKRPTKIKRNISSNNPLLKKKVWEINTTKFISNFITTSK